MAAGAAHLSPLVQPSNTLASQAACCRVLSRSETKAWEEEGEWCLIAASVAGMRGCSVHVAAHQVVLLL